VTGEHRARSDLHALADHQLLSEAAEGDGGDPAREFLKGKSFEERYQFGLMVLRRFGVLKE
jgi:hypothetical protein